MNSKEKAKELISKFRPYTKIIVADAEYIEDTKICALIAVDEVLASLDYDYIGFDRQNKYWQEVKQEIELL